MSTPTKTKWRITGEAFGSCNCAWGCPCQFNALPTHGRCEGLAAFEIHDGYFGDTRLDGVRYAAIYWWPGPIHEANGTRQVIIDEAATTEQREALIAMNSGNHGGSYFEIFTAVCPTTLEPVFAPITFETDRERRQARLVIPNTGEIHIEPIKNPVTGEEHRAKIVLPNGFEYTEAEMGNTTLLRVQSVSPLIFENVNTYAQLNTFDWSNA
jgi:hypothetical protein